MSYQQVYRIADHSELEQLNCELKEYKGKATIININAVSTHVNDYAYVIVNFDNDIMEDRK